MDALLGPATRVNQGIGMTDQIRTALAPGPEHARLRQLVGDWRVAGVAGRNNEPVAETAEVRAMLGGAWIELRLFSGREVSRVAHLGYDGYRGSYVLWEVGLGFTSPQIRAGDSHGNGRELRFRRRYTILRCDEPTTITERIIVSFLDDGRVRWQTFETIGSEPEHQQRDVTFSKIP